MLTTDELQSVAQRACPPWSSLLGDRLRGVAKGREVHIVGAGPSAKLFDREAIPPDAWVIACNNMVRFVQADVWITSEIAFLTTPCMATPVKFDGHVIWERGATYVSPKLMIEQYSEQFLRGVLWHNRVSWRDSYEWTGYGKGDCYGLWTMDQTDLPHKVNAQHGEVLGSVLLPAIHVGGMMLGGSGSLHVWGADMYFPGGKQHAYSERDPAYIDDEERKLARLCRFDMVDGLPVIKPSGQYESTPFFLESSLAIRHVLAHQGQTLDITDHSGGLLNPETAALVPAPRATPPPLEAVDAPDAMERGAAEASSGTRRKARNK